MQQFRHVRMVSPGTFGSESQGSPNVRSRRDVGLRFDELWDRKMCFQDLTLSRCPSGDPWMTVEQRHAMNTLSCSVSG